MTTPLRSRLRRAVVAVNKNPWFNALWIAVFLVNAVVGTLWSIMAPGQQFKVFSNGSYISLPTADYHPFEGLALFVLATAAIGLVSAVAIWRVREVRGVTTLVLLVIVSAVGSFVAAVIARLFGPSISPSDFASTLGNTVATVRPQLTTPLVLVAEPLVAALVYTFLVAWDGRPDLGRRTDLQPETGPQPDARPESETGLESRPDGGVLAETPERATT